MGIDSTAVKYFWDSQAKKIDEVPVESISNLEEDNRLLDLKKKLEREKVFSILQLDKKMSVLDLGAGVGNWSILFAPKCKEVHAVEYSEKIAEIGEKRVKELGIKNIEYFARPAQKFISDINYDMIFISGLFVYLNDDECEELLSRISSYSSLGTELILRDGTAVDERHEIRNKYSENVKAMYSSIYRTSETYKKYFAQIGFEAICDEDMFPPGCELNKYKETCLRVYVFKKVR